MHGANLSHRQDEGQVTQTADLVFLSFTVQATLHIVKKITQSYDTVWLTNSANTLPLHNHNYIKYS